MRRRRVGTASATVAAVIEDAAHLAALRERAAWEPYVDEWGPHTYTMGTGSSGALRHIGVPVVEYHAGYYLVPAWCSAVLSGLHSTVLARALRRLGPAGARTVYELCGAAAIGVAGAPR